jgi:hypothetical protein
VEERFYLASGAFDGRHCRGSQRPGREEEEAVILDEVLSAWLWKSVAVTLAGDCSH